jgi:hypothetical protein
MCHINILIKSYLKKISENHRKLLIKMKLFLIFHNAHHVTNYGMMIIYDRNELKPISIMLFIRVPL